MLDVVLGSASDATGAHVKLLRSVHRPSEISLCGLKGCSLLSRVEVTSVRSDESGDEICTGEFDLCCQFKDVYGVFE